jgi:signal transduction histidine kinase
MNHSGSPVHLAKSLFNLLANAAGHAPGGPADRRTANRTWTGRSGSTRCPGGDYAVLTVADTGSGIPRADCRHLRAFYTKKVMGRAAPAWARGGSGGP